MCRYEEPHDFLGKISSESLIERISFIKREFPRVLYIGSYADFIPQLQILGHGKETVLHVPVLRRDSVLEQLPHDHPWGQIDLVVCNLNLQWVNDLPGLLWQIRLLLKPDGLFIGSLLGGDTLMELKDSFMKAEIQLYQGMSPRVAPMVDLYSASQLLLRADFKLPVADREVVKASYADATSLMHDLRSMGLTNMMRARNKGAMSRILLKRLEEIYNEHYPTPEGRLQTTYEIIFLTGWSYHESQQKALKPGSAKTSLVQYFNDETLS